MSFERIKYYFDAGLWSKPMVKMAVKKGVITSVQYAEITGEAYPEDGEISAKEALAELEEVLA